MKLCRYGLGVLVLVGTVMAIPTVAAEAVNVIVEVQGEARVRRNSTSQYSSVMEGMTLELGDLLIPKQGAVIKVHCEDGRIMRVRSGVPSGLGAICPTGGRFAPHNGPLRVPRR